MRPLAALALLLLACHSGHPGPVATPGQASTPCDGVWVPQTLCGGDAYTEHPPVPWCDEAVDGESVIVTLVLPFADHDERWSSCGTCTDGGIYWDTCTDDECRHYECDAQRRE